ncbi:MAG: lysophospholipid acyltransferase family protein [Magnetococcales bacterium]|nr:lysophospholipid acyltransferase family protein [Magnetococcales bacterium]
MERPLDSRPKPIHYLEWLLLRAVLARVARGSLGDAAGFAVGLGRLARRALRREWAWARTNLRLVYGPQPPQAAIDRLAARAFENHFLSYIEGLRVRDVTFGGDTLSGLAALHRSERRLIMTSIHLGSWEPGLLRMGQAGLPLAVVYRHANNPLSERLFQAARAQYGVTLIRRGDQRAILAALKAGDALSLMVDINTRQGGIVAPFLGLPALCPAGPARLAARYQCPVVPAVGIREAPGRVSMAVGEPLAPPPARADAEELAAFTGRINRAFEPWILAHPEQYNWLHARWRSRPDGRLLRPDAPLPPLWAQRDAPHPPFPTRWLESDS